MSWIIKSSPVLKLFEPLREPQPLKVGDRVRFSPEGLESFGTFWDEPEELEGVISDIRGDNSIMCTVEWDDFDEIRKYWPTRLERVE